MNQTMNSGRDRGSAATLAAYGAGLTATAAGIAYTAIDQFAVHGLDAHLRSLYEPVGKYGESAPIYLYLYALGVIGIGCWLTNIRLVKRGASSARRWAWITLAASALPVFAPLAIVEYGQTVIPLALSVGYVVAWLFGLVGGIATRCRPVIA